MDSQVRSRLNDVGDGDDGDRRVRGGNRLHWKRRGVDGGGRVEGGLDVDHDSI
jgi:hypothetical protein